MKRVILTLALLAVAGCDVSPEQAARLRAFSAQMMQSSQPAYYYAPPPMNFGTTQCVELVEGQLSCHSW